MARKPSDATLLVRTKAELKRAKDDIKSLTSQLSGTRSLVTDYRARATKAEQEVAEWKNRFDLLLKREPIPVITGPMPPLLPDPNQCSFCGGWHGAGMPCPKMVPMCATSTSEAAK
jgi:hypothetical protein